MTSLEAYLELRKQLPGLKDYKAGFTTDSQNNIDQYFVSYFDQSTRIFFGKTYEEAIVGAVQSLKKCQEHCDRLG